MLSLDSTTPQEQDTRVCLADKTVELSDMEAQIPIAEAICDQQLQHLKTDRLSVVDQRKRLKTRLSYSKRVGNPTEAIQQQILPLDTQLATLDCQKSRILSQRNSVIESHRLLKNEVASLKRDADNFMKDRKQKEDSIDTLAEKILIRFGVKIDAYHGGTLVGPAILKLFSNIDPIFEEIVLLGEQRIAQRIQDDTPLRPPPSFHEFRSVLKQHKHLLQIQNSVYAGLRTISPSKKQLHLTKSDLSAMKKLWKQLNFSFTPKAHLLFSHAYDDMVRFDGLGDKTEDFIEKRHQDQKRFNSITYRQSKKTHQLSSQDIMEWREQDPAVQDQIMEVYASDRRSRGQIKQRNAQERSGRKRVHCENRKSNAKRIKIDLAA